MGVRVMTTVEAQSYVCSDWIGGTCSLLVITRTDVVHCMALVPEERRTAFLPFHRAAMMRPMTTGAKKVSPPPILDRNLVHGEVDGGVCVCVCVSVCVKGLKLADRRVGRIIIQYIIGLEREARAVG